MQQDQTLPAIQLLNNYAVLLPLQSSNGSGKGWGGGSRGILNRASEGQEGKKKTDLEAPGLSGRSKDFSGIYCAPRNLH